MFPPKLRFKLKSFTAEAEGHFAVVIMAALIGIPLILWLTSQLS